MSKRSKYCNLGFIMNDITGKKIKVIVKKKLYLICISQTKCFVYRKKLSEETK